MKLYKYTVSDLREAVRDSMSIRQVLQKLGVEAYGGNYATFRRAVKYFDIDTSHFKGQSWNKGRKHSPKRPLEDYLSNKHKINSHRLRKRLLKEKVLPHLCSCCNISKWLGNDIPLELHHRDGNRYNNNLENLKLLCPTCHALTDNYRGAAKKYKITGSTITCNVTCNTSCSASCDDNELTKIKLINYKKCKHCNEKFEQKKTKTTYCSTKCYHLSTRGNPHPTKINWPNKEELKKLVWSKPSSQLAKELGVSDKAITKRCKKYKISKPPRGYWAKKKAGTI